MALTIERQRALGLQVNPVDVVLGSATDLGAQGRDDQFGFGLVSPNRALSTLNTLQATGGALPVIALAEVTTRAVKRVRITVRKGYLKYRIPAKGRFIVGWQSYSQRKWSELNRFNGKRDGQTWYTVRSSAACRSASWPCVGEEEDRSDLGLPHVPNTCSITPIASPHGNLRRAWSGHRHRGRRGVGLVVWWLTGSSLWIGILAAIGAVIGMNTGWGKTDG